MKSVSPRVAVAALALLLPEPASAQWTTIEPGGATVCSDGSPYRFFVHAGDPGKLLVEFEGGGGCWSGATCSQDIYNRRVLSDPEAARAAGQLQGIYDRSRLDNPLRDFTHVYVPYCTGDLHWGSSATVYEGPAGPLTIQHAGGRNAAAAVAWSVENVPAPAELVVAGCSAGGYGATLWSAHLARAYPAARLAHLSDSAAGVVPEGFFRTLLSAWGAAEYWPSFVPGLALDRVDPASLSAPSLYASIAAENPRGTFSQFNTTSDTVQTFFFALASGALSPTIGSEWTARMGANVDAIASAVPNFRSFTAPGTDHCIINKAAFYSTSVGGRRFADWARDLVSGADPGTVR
jgi:hypothetical protein